MQTAGESKAGLDPYMPQRSRDLASQRRLLRELHDNVRAAEALRAFSTSPPLQPQTGRPRKRLHVTPKPSPPPQFISAVREGRGDRLRPEEAACVHYTTTGLLCGGAFGSRPSKRHLAKLVRNGAGMFDGSVYTGEVARTIGFVDELGEMRTVLQRRYGRYER